MTGEGRGRAAWSGVSRLRTAAGSSQDPDLKRQAARQPSWASAAARGRPGGLRVRRRGEAGRCLGVRRGREWAREVAAQNRGPAPSTPPLPPGWSAEPRGTPSVTWRPPGAHGGGSRLPCTQDRGTPGVRARSLQVPSSGLVGCRGPAWGNVLQQPDCLSSWPCLLGTRHPKLWWGALMLLLGCLFSALLDPESTLFLSSCLSRRMKPRFPNSPSTPRLQNLGAIWGDHAPEHPHSLPARITPSLSVYPQELGE